MGWGSQALEEANAAACMDAGILDQADAHQSKGRCDVQVLCGGLDAEHTDQVGAADVQRHAHQIGDIALSTFAQQAHKEIIDRSNDCFQDGLPLGDVIHPQIPRQQDGTDDKKRHDAPAHDHGLRNGKPEHRDHVNIQLFFQSSSQRIH